MQPSKTDFDQEITQLKKTAANHVFAAMATSENKLLLKLETFRTINISLVREACGGSRVHWPMVTSFQGNYFAKLINISPTAPLPTSWLPSVHSTN